MPFDGEPECWEEPEGSRRRWYTVGHRFQRKKRGYYSLDVMDGGKWVQFWTIAAEDKLTAYARAAFAMRFWP